MFIDARGLNVHMGDCGNQVTPGDLLIRNVHLGDGDWVDVLCIDGRVREIHRFFEGNPYCRTFDADGGALLLGLHDRHIHLMSLAASRISVNCGPPGVATIDDFIDVLQCARGSGWLRGIGYHESVAGELTRWRLDEIISSRPLRVQHRSGKLWILNSAACERVGLGGSHDGQLFRQDRWLRSRIGVDEAVVDELKSLSKELASYGLTDVTDASPSNNEKTLELLRRHMPELNVHAMGDETLLGGERKLILDEAALPDFDEFRTAIAEAHVHQMRNVAVHCVTRTEVVFALAAFQSVGVFPGDRLEHASVTDDACLEQISRLRLAVVTQPVFIWGRGDQYLNDVDETEIPWLYRGKSFIKSDVALLAGSDAPFGNPDPWLAMRAAMHRRTRNGNVLGPQERLRPEQALGLYAPGLVGIPCDPLTPEVGDKANFCVLRSPWSELRSKGPDHTDVILTTNAGNVTFERS